MVRYQIALSACELSMEDDPLREPPRHFTLRHEQYEDDFDFTTLFYDCFWDPVDQRKAILIGPPGLNLPIDLELEVKSYPSGATCELRRLGTCSLTHSCEVPPGTYALVFKTKTKEFYIAIQPNHTGLFQDRRVITTISKDNDLQWIEDWATFYKHKHGCNGVLLYDNNSNHYSVEEIYRRLDLLELTVVILKWPFAYGVADWRKAISYGTTDSRYCQQGMLEHARYRFLANAKSVLNADIDELVITENGSSVFELAERSPTGYLEFGGKWVENHRISCRAATNLVPRHKDYGFISQVGLEGCRPKWVVVPAKVPCEAQWHVHRLLGMNSSHADEGIELRHFKAINTGWKPDELGSFQLRTESPTAHPEELYMDLGLRGALEDVFASEEVTLPEIKLAVPPLWAAYRLRRRGARYAEAKSWSEGIEAVESALKLIPNHPGFHLYLAQLHTKAGDSMAAAKHIAEANALREKDPWFHFQKGYWCFEGGLMQARNCFERAIAIDPSFTLPYHALAEQEQLSGRPAKALAILQKSVANSPNDAVSHALLAREFERRGRKSDALKSCEAAITHDAANPHFQCLRASMLRQLGRLAEAEEILRKGIAEDSLLLRMTRRENRWSATTAGVERRFYDESSEHKLHTELVYVLLQKRDLPSAESAARQLLSLTRTASSGYRLLGQVLVMQGKKEEAKEILARGISIASRQVARPILNSETQSRWEKGGVSRADQMAQLLRLADRKDEAIVLLKGALSAAPDSTLLHLRLAELLGETDDLEGAVEILLAGIARKPEEAALHAKLSVVLADRDLEGAIEAARTAVAIESDNPVLGKRLAKFLMEAGQHKEAERVLLSSLAIEPHDGELQFRLSKVLQQQQQLEAALDPARRAIELAPQNANYRDHLAALLVQQDHMEEAEAILRQALEDSVQNGAIHYRLSRLLQKRGCLEDALAAASAAVRLEPDKTFVRRHLAALLNEAGRDHEAESVLKGAPEIEPTKPRSSRVLWSRYLPALTRKITGIQSADT